MEVRLVFIWSTLKLDLWAAVQNGLPPLCFKKRCHIPQDSHSRWCEIVNEALTTSYPEHILGGSNMLSSLIFRVHTWELAGLYDTLGSTRHRTENSSATSQNQLHGKRCQQGTDVQRCRLTRARCPPTTGRARKPFAVPPTVSNQSPRGCDVRPSAAYFFTLPMS